MASIRSSLPFGIALALTSCVLPVPNVTAVREGVSGKVVTQGTGRPIAGAEVRVRYRSPFEGGAEQSTTTGPRGFRIPAVYRWNWGYMFGPISSPLPYRGPQLTQKPCEISIHAKNHAHYVWRSHSASEDLPRTFRLQPTPSGS